MGTTEVLKILKSGEELTSADIAQQIDTALTTVYTSLRRLTKDVSVNLQYRHLKPEEKIERYGRYIGRKIKIYWIDG